MAWPPTHDHTIPCVYGFGMAVHAAHGWVVVSGYDDKRLHVYSLADGALLHSYGGPGDGRGQFSWENGGVCVSPRGTVLVAERYNRRLQEVDVLAGSHLRMLADGCLDDPEFVSCSAAGVLL